MKLFTLLLFGLFLSTTISMAQNNQNFDCKILKDIKLKYANNKDKTAYIIIKDSKHVEHLEGDKYFIKSDLEWINDCEYNAKMTEITLTNFPFKAGEVMNVKFEKIKDDIVYGTATVRNQTFPVKFIIIK